MITDALFKRYPNQWLYDKVPHELLKVLRQAAIILQEDVAPHISDRDRFFETSHKRLARELGGTQLAQGRSYEECSIRFISEQYDLWNDAHQPADFFFKIRLSLVELLFREAESRFPTKLQYDDLKTTFGLLGKLRIPRSSSDLALESIVRSIDELNSRFKEAGLPFVYHNGIIQRSDDALTSEQIEAPFWQLVSDPKWKNVETDIKEAIDRRDSEKSDAAFFALRALESTIKILSEELGLTKGTENGASAFIDNLVSNRNGRFIEVWESEALRHLFREIRNVQGHGPGSALPLTLSPQQSTFVIECSMSWVKSLVRRKP